jgi:hypothetical protein
MAALRREPRPRQKWESQMTREFASIAALALLLVSAWGICVCLLRKKYDRLESDDSLEEIPVRDFAVVYNNSKRKIRECLDLLAEMKPDQEREKTVLLYLLFCNGVSYVNLKHADRSYEWMRIEGKGRRLENWIFWAKYVLSSEEVEDAIAKREAVQDEAERMRIESIEMFLEEYGQQIFGRPYVRGVREFLVEPWERGGLEHFLNDTPPELDEDG